MVPTKIPRLCSGTLFDLFLEARKPRRKAKNKLSGGMTIDRITAYDFMTIYGSDLGVSEKNLHGINHFSFSEFTSKHADSTVQFLHHSSERWTDNNS